MLQPTINWYWFCDSHRLMLSLNKTLQFQTAYTTSRLLNVPDSKVGFSICDSERYMALAEQLQSSHLRVSNAVLTQIALNAVAALKFHKPLTLRSWYFSEQYHSGAIRQLASLENVVGKGDVLVVEQNKSVASCMVISEQLMLTASKKLAQFDLIKVMNNRLIPYITQMKPISQTA